MHAGKCVKSASAGAGAQWSKCVERKKNSECELARLLNLTTPSQGSVAICRVVQVWHAPLYMMLQP